VAAVKSGRSTLLGDGPVALRRAVEADLGRQLGATYKPAGARLTGAGFAFGVGRVSVGRAGSMRPIAAKLVHTRAGVVYGGPGVKDTFRSTTAGIEQSFKVTGAKSLRAGSRSRSGPLVITVPVSGLVATTDGAAVDLRDSKGVVRATYSGFDQPRVFRTGNY
jgi:hypothetical protein